MATWIEIDKKHYNLDCFTHIVLYGSTLRLMLPSFSPHNYQDFIDTGFFHGAEEKLEEINKLLKKKVSKCT